MTAPARSAALLALVSVETGRRSLPAELARLRERLPEERDRGLAASIVNGTLRWQRASDHLIAHFARRSVDALDLEIRLILRLSLFQLLHLDRVPASAVVDDAVTLARTSGKGSASGFVNAVLRATLRQRHRLPLPPRPEDSGDRTAAVRYLGITWSHPEWLVERWLARYGFDRTERWVQFNNAPAPLTLCINRLRASREEVQALLRANGGESVPTRWAPNGLTVTAGNPLRHASDGLFFVQDEASQLVPLALDAQPGDQTLDLCASPGGKTVNLAGDMRDTGLIVACDVRTRRMTLLRETLRVAGSRHTHAVQIAASGALPFRPCFDRVLVDAPCSGLGTIRRDPDIKWRRQASDLQGHAARQLQLLARTAPLVRHGGRLVYATCSSEPDENEAVVDAFLTTHAGYQLVDLRTHGPSPLRGVLDDRGMLQTRPFEHDLEAFFAAALERAH